MAKTYFGRNFDPFLHRAEFILQNFVRNIVDSPIIPKYKATTRSTLQDRQILPVAKYGGRFLVSMIPGDGIGKEVMCHVREIIKLMCAPIDFEMIDFDEPSDIHYIIHATRRNQCAIKGHMERWYTHKHHFEFDSPNVELRKKLELFAYLTEFRTYKKVKCKFPGVDIALVRQNTEGEYSMLEHESVKGVVNSLKIHTRTNAEKIAEFALNYAINNNRKHITVVHKANKMKQCDGLFVDACYDLAKDYDVKMTDMIVDHVCMELLLNPHQFDMILCPNLYGNIMCHIICGLTGGPGLLSSCNFGDNCAVFEPTCRSRAMSMKGRNQANPTSFLNAAVHLLAHLGLCTRAELLREAIRKTIEDDEILTQDVGGSYCTDDFMLELKKNLWDLMCQSEDGLSVACPAFCEQDPSVSDSSKSNHNSTDELCSKSSDL